MAKQSQTVQQYLDDISMMNSGFHSAATAARELFHSHGPNLGEEIKYGGIVYLRDGKIIGGIYVYKEHLSIEFSNGAKFEDPDGILQGKGKARRHLKFAKTSDLEDQKAESFIKQACVV